jgi:branched-chain amino acid transport system ATP-binding protein
MTGEALLEVRDLDCGYGLLQVLFGVSLTVPVGGRVVLLGTNAAGKSTLLRAVAGLLAPTRGQVFYRGQDVTALRPETRVEQGVTLIASGRAIFPSLTVYENLVLGAYPIMDDRPAAEARVEEALELFPHLRARAGQAAGTLSGGEQQMVILGRAFIAKPSLLLIDELSMGLAPVVLAELVRAVEAIAERGTSLLIVEQSLNVAATIAEHAYFMEKGEIRFSGPVAELMRRDDLVRSVFFGSRSGRRSRQG